MKIKMSLRDQCCNFFLWGILVHITFKRNGSNTFCPIKLHLNFKTRNKKLSIGRESVWNCLIHKNKSLCFNKILMYKVKKNFSHKKIQLVSGHIHYKFIPHRVANECQGMMSQWWHHQNKTQMPSDCTYSQTANNTA